MLRETRPVLIVGAGPTGLTAAMELTRFGVPVRLVDKYTSPPDTSRALAVQSRTMELLQQRGLADRMLRLGNRAYAATFHAGKDVLGHVNFRSLDSRFNFIFLLSQSETERTLRDHLERAGVRVESQTELVACSTSNTGVRATLRTADGDEELLDAAYLIDTEGAHSIVRHVLGVPFEGASLPNTYVVADLYLDGDVPEDELSIHLADTGLVAAFPMGDRRFRIILTEKDEVAADAPAPTVQEVQVAWSASVDARAMFRDMQWSSRFQINSRAVNRLRHDRIFFAGDSAHIHSPAGGQGMNTGIQDTINLGWKLAMVYRGIATDALLDTYDEERMPVIHDLVYRTERATDIMNSNNHMLQTLLRLAMPFALGFDGVRRQGATLVSELGTNYRKSSLNGKAENATTLHAGDRFPDLAIEDGNASRMLDVLDPSRFTVLSTARTDVSGLERIRDRVDLCVTQLIANPSAALTAVLGEATTAVVRPDGYLLCTGTASSVSAQMQGWLDRFAPNSSATASDTLPA